MIELYQKIHFMEGNFNNHHRRSIRLPGTDYSVPGFYFITIGVKNRECLFGEVVDSEMTLNEYGEIVKNCWNDIPNHFENTYVDEFMVMPNHVHGIVVIGDNDAFDGRGMIYHAPTLAEFGKPVAGSVGTIIGNFKAAVTRTINRKTDGRFVVWQRNYFEHIIRDPKSLERIRVYIRSNPFNWQMDLDNMATQHTMTEKEYIKKTKEHYRGLFG